MKSIILFLLSLLCTTITEAQRVYIPQKEFIFEVQVIMGSEKEVQYISMWTTGNIWKVDSSQKELFFAYHKHRNNDVLSASWPYRDNVETTGLIENDGYMWLHPPRWEKLSVLEYFPFPEITKNMECDSKYGRIFFGRVDFLDRWMLLRYKMFVECDGNKTIIRGKAKSRRGEWLEEMVFDKEKGFTDMFFYAPDNVEIKLKLIDVVEHVSMVMK